MITYTRKELMSMFDMCGNLAKYHLEAGKLATAECKFDEATKHKDIVNHYISVRADLIKLMLDGV